MYYHSSDEWKRNERELRIEMLMNMNSGVVVSEIIECEIVNVLDEIDGKLSTELFVLYGLAIQAATTYVFVANAAAVGSHRMTSKLDQIKNHSSNRIQVDQNYWRFPDFYFFFALKLISLINVNN